MLQHNGASERRNRTLLDMVRFMMDLSSLSIFFWGYALESACYVLNRVPSKSVSKIPHKIWTGRKPVLSHFRIWGCPTYVKYLKMDKLRARTDKYIFVDYPKETKGYYFYLADEQNVFVSLRAVFLKKKILKKELMPLRLNLRKFNR